MTKDTFVLERAVFYLEVDWGMLFNSLNKKQFMSICIGTMQNDGDTK